MFDWWAVVEPLAWTGGKLLAAGRVVRNFVKPAAPAAHWQERLNHVYGADVCIRALVDAEPLVQIERPLELASEERSLVARFRRELAINDAVAIVIRPIAWSDRPILIRVAQADYAAVCALDTLGRRPTMLSANALLYCPETREIVVHRRSDASRDYAGLLHTFGGGYQPPINKGRDYDHLSLPRAARRETDEESGISFDILKLPPMLIGEEPKIGFVHMALLGVRISKETLLAARGNHEGSITRIGIDELPRRLAEPDWAAAGRVQVLSWLALGAPIGQRRIRFGQESGQQIFNRLVA